MDDSDAKTRFLEIYILNVVTELFQTAIYSSLFRKNLVFSVALWIILPIIDGQANPNDDENHEAGR